VDQKLSDCAGDQPMTHGSWKAEGDLSIYNLPIQEPLSLPAAQTITALQPSATIKI